MNPSTELSKVAAQLSRTQSNSAAIDASNQKAVAGSGLYDLGKLAAEFILGAMLRAYEECLLTDRKEDLKAGKSTLAMA